MMNVRRLLGKLSPILDPRTLALDSVLRVGVRPAPPMRDWSAGLPYDLGMLHNDECGDCAYAALSHLSQVMTEGRYTPDADAVRSAYCIGTGYIPGNAATDQGAAMLDVLRQSRTSGIDDHKIGAFAKLRAGDIDHVKFAINEFGGVYLGAQLPLSTQDTGDVWSRPAISTEQDRPGSWGGHAMAAIGYDRSHVTFITWGKRQSATWDWWLACVDEAYAVFSDDWIQADGSAPVGLDKSALLGYLDSLA